MVQLPSGTYLSGGAARKTAALPPASTVRVKPKALPDGLSLFVAFDTSSKRKLKAGQELLLAGNGGSPAPRVVTSHLGVPYTQLHVEATQRASALFEAFGGKFERNMCFRQVTKVCVWVPLPPTRSMLPTFTHTRNPDHPHSRSPSLTQSPCYFEMQVVCCMTPTKPA